MTIRPLGLRGVLSLVTLGLLIASSAHAEVLRVVVDRREVLLDGRPFGEAGVYEKLVGRIYFAFDPDNPANAAVVDLRLTPRNGDGKVEAWADFMVLQPVDPALRRGVAWLEVSNRGGKASLRYFNGARGALDPTDPQDFGDGLLLRQGLTLLWVGWQWDVPAREGLLRLRVPMARGPGGETLEGLVRSDWTVDQDTDTLGLGHRGHQPFFPVDPESTEHELTERDGREAPRRVVPRERWRFVEMAEGGEAAPVRMVSITLDGGFRAGRIYELVYRGRDPRVGGLGLAVVRDVMSYVKYDLRSEFPARLGVGFGVSQTGRFLRQFLYQGFNVDEGGRKVFDGLLIHTAGAGRGSFNHRFGQPSRGAHRYSAFFYPTDLFPFTSSPQLDPILDRQEGLLDRTPVEARPRTLVTNTGYEYWGRAASLVHTTVDGYGDVEPLPEERLYHLAGGQQFVGGFPPREEALLPGSTSYLGNPVDFLMTLRALAVGLVSWVADDATPPASRVPAVAEGTLVPPAGLAFPRLPGLAAPDVAHLAYRTDYGPRFTDQGIVDRQPPELGMVFPSLVPQVDGMGNAMAGVRGLELRVPLATYTPWSLRTGMPGPEGELRDFVGTVTPLPLTEEIRERTGDTRPSIQRLYGSREAYLRRVRAAIDDLVHEGFLLDEDRGRALAWAERLWSWATNGA